MRSLPLPVPRTAEVLTLCISGTEDAFLKGRLHGIANELNLAESAYLGLAVQQELHLLDRKTGVGSVASAELTQLYSDHLSATNGEARHIYDLIRNAPPHKKCPLCGVGAVAVLDHHLPKSKYPDFAVTPANLVPACHHCNDRKRAKFPRNAFEQTLHPYFDGYLTGQWVFARLEPVTPLVLAFFVRPPDHWSLVDKARVQRHFEVCALSVVFTTNANDELIVLKDHLMRLHAAGGELAVQSYATEQASVHAPRPNSWQYAMYQALAADPWFVAGGFHNIA